MKIEIKTINNTCIFCSGNGIAKYFDLNTIIKNGEYDLNALIGEHGIYDRCPEGCIIMN